MGASQITQLDYASGRGWVRRHRRWIALAIILATGTVGFWQRGRLADFSDCARAWWYERQCRAYERPAGWVVYDEGPQGLDELAKTDPGYLKFRQGQIVSGGPEVRADYVGYVPACFRDWLGPSAAGSYAPVVFLHDRRTPSGKVRLVLVTVLVLPPPFSGQYLQATDPASLLIGMAFEHGTLLSQAKGGPTLTSVSVAYRPKTDHGALRLTAGQVDPNDPTHFTIPYKLPRREGVIDGWLRDDGTVQLRTRGFD